jgi:hypothetical protein
VKLTNNNKLNFNQNQNLLRLPLPRVLWVEPISLLYINQYFELKLHHQAELYMIMFYLIAPYHYLNLYFHVFVFLILPKQKKKLVTITTFEFFIVNRLRLNAKKIF